MLIKTRTSKQQVAVYSFCDITVVLETCDDTMADRDVDIEDDLPVGVTLIILPFLKGHFKFSLKDEVHPRRIAPLRTHDERAIQRTKAHKIL